MAALTRLATHGVRMSLSRALGLCAILWLMIASARAETPMPQGEFFGRGVYCNFGLRFVVPRGYEGIAFGQGVVFRKIGGRILKIDVDYYPAREDLPGFSIFRDLADLRCGEEYLEEMIEFRRTVEGVDSVRLLEEICIGASSTYGVMLVRADLTFKGEPFVGHVKVMFGDVDFRAGVETFGPDEYYPEDEARAFVDEVTAGLGVCAQ